MHNLFDYFKRDLIFLDFESDNQINFFGKIYKILEERGDVKFSFLNSIIEREKEFPTGLDLGKYKIAIPHTNPEHINTEAIVFVRNKNKIVFRDMGMDLNDLETDFIFVLLVKKNGEQIEVLENLMNLLSEEKLLDELKNSETEEDIYNLLREKNKIYGRKYYEKNYRSMRFRSSNITNSSFKGRKAFEGEKDKCKGRGSGYKITENIFKAE